MGILLGRPVDERVNDFDEEKNINVDKRVNAFDEERIISLYSNINVDKRVNAFDGERRISLYSNINVDKRKNAFDGERGISLYSNINVDKRVNAFEGERRISLYSNINVDKRVNAFDEERKISLYPNINVDKRVNAWNDTVFDEERRISLYSNKQHILLVGEGDFSFANALATAFVSAPALVATSLDSLEILQRMYPLFNFTLQSLIRSGVVLMHGVDATSMAEDERLRSLSFDRIVYNFPHAGFRFSESSSSQIEANKQLLRGFFDNAARLLKDQGGEVHVTHHLGRRPYTEWNLQGEAAKSGLALKLCVQFHASTYPGYVNRKGAGFNCAETFPLHLSGTHIFCKSSP